MALDVIPTLPLIYDEPLLLFPESPPVWSPSFARESVTVSLSGDGADELFAGYMRYFYGQTLWSATRPAPLWSRQLLAGDLAQSSKRLYWRKSLHPICFQKVFLRSSPARVYAV